MITLNSVAGNINTALPEPYASLLNGIVWGIPLSHLPQLAQLLKQAGIIHIAVLSGANITLLVSIISHITSKFSRNISIVINMLLVIIFTSFVSLQAPVLRASISAVLTYVAIMYGRKASAFYILLISGFISCILFPSWLTSVSFQLSYGATLGLVLFSFKSPFRNAFLSYCYEEIMCSLSAQIFTVPIIFFYFHQVSLIAPITNLLISWTIAPLMIMGFIISFAGYVSPLLAFPFSIVAFVLMKWILLITETITKIPYSFIQL